MFARQFAASSLLAGAIALIAANAFSASESTNARSGAERSVDSEIARYCGAVAPSAAEARLAWQMKRLAEMETRVRQALDELRKREGEAREWVQKRDQMTKAANEDVVGIYAKMPAEGAAAQLGAMDETVAVSVLMKLKPQVAAGILNEMDPDRAGHLASMISGGAPGAGKS
jgi:flagellar motility protein MotE (MotC chaperone)